MRGVMEGGGPILKLKRTQNVVAKELNEHRMHILD